MNKEKNSSQMLLYLFDFQNLWNSGGFEAQEKLTLRVTGGVCVALERGVLSSMAMCARGSARLRTQQCDDEACKKSRSSKKTSCWPALHARATGTTCFKNALPHVVITSARKLRCYFFVQSVFTVTDATSSLNNSFLTLTRIRQLASRGGAHRHEDGVASRRRGRP